MQSSTILASTPLAFTQARQTPRAAKRSVVVMASKVRLEAS